MARRAAAPSAPSAAKQNGGKAALFVKKLPRAIIWVTLIFALIGMALGAVLGLLGNLAHSITPIVPGFWLFFKLGFVFGFGGLFVLYLRFSGFEDVQEGGRAFFASVGIVLGMAAALRMLTPLFEEHADLQRLAIGGIVLTAIVLIINIFMKHEYKHVVGWTAFLIAAAFVCLLFINMTDGKGFEIGWGGWGNKSADSGPKTIRLNPLNTTETFSNLSGPLSNRFEASARAESLRWTLEEGSSCGVVIINDTHRVRQCPEEKEIPSLRAAGVLRPYENMHTLQFEGVGMAGKVTAAW